jgi:hypothetical protein
MPGQLFDTSDEKFSFEANEVIITCQRLNVQGSVAYYVEFSSERKPIVVAKAAFVTSPATWTSIPEGRQKEAEGVGKLIELYLTKKD